ncbi:FAS1-like dehydratase domain-containing protein [Nocardia spumae]|uniref:FAS1-like dehydratase domain-containing protein n=1 Tax=Nocardia spumae TaxID=2887190 RepID=UPI001D15642C|nr:MaoC family dehydratase N-terminal domain-containing protein [Nocardia spumae]
MVSASPEVPVAPLHGEHRFRSRSEYAIVADVMRDYARAVGADDPIHCDERAAAARGFAALVAPPTFATTIWMRAEERILDALVPGFHSGRVVHADRTLEIARPLLAGDRIGCEVDFESFRHYRDYDVVSVTTVLRDHDGQVTTTGSSTLLVHTRPVGCGQPGLPRQPQDLERVPVRRRLRTDRRDRITSALPRPIVDLGPLAVGADLPDATVTIAAADVMRHAGAVDSSAGAPGHATAVPGMLTFGLISGYLGRWLGDPTALTKLRVQYAPRMHYLPVGPDAPAPIRFGGQVGWLSSRRRMVTVVVDALSKGRKLFGYATAEARLG